MPACRARPLGRLLAAECAGRTGGQGPIGFVGPPAA